MKKFLTGAFILSLVGIGGANATEVKPFVGANLGISGISWTDYAEEVMEPLGSLPTSFLSLGIDAGIRLKNDKMYNFGVTFAYDYMADSKADLNSDVKDYVSTMKFVFSTFGATLDNYFRISDEGDDRSDIVVGLGFGGVRERVYLKPTATGLANGLQKVDDYDTGGAFILKLAFNMKINDKWDWNITGRWFIQGGSSDEKDFDSLFNLTVGARYVF